MLLVVVLDVVTFVVIILELTLILEAVISFPINESLKLTFDVFTESD